MKSNFSLTHCAPLLALSVVASPVMAAAVLPSFVDATFTPGAAIDNTYFPLLDNLTRVYAGDEERFELTVVGSGPVLLGVQTLARRDREFEDDVLQEDTFDYYAQDDDGNVWYFGEDVTNYIYDDDGVLIGTNSHSSWLAGENSAMPGFAMPADLSQAFHYYQEFAPFDAAVDEGMTLATDRTVTIGLDTYTNVMAVLETSATSPDTREIKYYAPGIGLIAADEGLDLDLENPELRLELISVSAVPLPAPALLLGSALFGLSLIRRRLDV